jgi:hypothetical protein
MSHRQMIFLAAVAALGMTCASAEAFARGGHAGGGAVAHRGAVGVGGGAAGYRGAVGVGGGAIGYRGGVNGWGHDYYRPGVGLAAGAVVGGAIAASQYGYGGYGYGYGQGPGYYGNDPGYYSTGYSTGYAPGGQDASYCVQRYRSYDPASGTYLGNDGRRHPCP